MIELRYFRFIWALIMIMGLAYNLDAKTSLTKELGTPSSDTTMVMLPWLDENVAIENDSIVGDTIIYRDVTPIPIGMYREPVFDGFHLLDTLTVISVKRNTMFPEVFYWLDDYNSGMLLLKHVRQNYIVNNPGRIRYNAEMLPVKPEEYSASADPFTKKIKLKEVYVNVNTEEVAETAPEIERKIWLQDFNGSIQFSQAFVSPNWYQGGNNSLIMLVNALYNVKLNQKFYPKLLFETTISYKLGLNTVPDDTIHSYSISEDLFRINSTFGYKAAKHWYYSFSLQFKTQLLNSYASNSTTLRSAFLSPAELNIGAGMTYDYTNSKNTFSFKGNIDPISWQLKTCINKRINSTAFDIPEGHKWTSHSGSSIGYTMMWKLTYNIVYDSRLFIFTDYKQLQADWEHKIGFIINKYLKTNINVNLRYDTDTPSIPDSKWRKFQMKEILSFGFSYTFSNTRP